MPDRCMYDTMLTFAPFLFKILFIFLFHSSTLSLHRGHREHQGGALQWAQPAPGHRAQYRGEDDRKGSVGQQD